MLSSWCYVVLLAFLPTLTLSKTTKECSCGYGGLCINSDENGEPVEPHCDSCKNVSGRFYESDCQTIVNHCKPNPCKRGNCVPTFGSYFCNCPPHYAGQKCQYAGEQALCKYQGISLPIQNQGRVDNSK
ncbi:unnamed protein product [Nesidiocoris tenuis]|uniref:EGF-like domain-containing protein n=1 Tax=Nesidiocoris tenuis TaxID=355587 RepID=A0A6H5H3C7_9HEMI|nr:unnamed protein product [Nesidiocoris tenuis]